MLVKPPSQGGWGGGGYEELFVEDSTTSCEAGPHNHQGEEPEEPEGDDGEMMER